MSRVTSNTNISQVGAVRSGSTLTAIGSAIAGVGSAVAGFVSIASEELLTGNVDLQTSKFRVSDSSLLYSTPVCSKEFSDLFLFNYNHASANVSDLVIRNKRSLIKTLAQSAFTVSDTIIVEEKLITALKSADVKSFNTATKTLFAEIKAQHSQVVSKELVAKVKESAIEIGFTNVKFVEMAAHKTIIVAENSQGQAIVNEIITDKTLHIHHSFETIGVTDNSCEKIKKQFQDKLKSKGVIAGQTESKPTAGVPFMQSSKEAFKIMQSRKNKERTRFRNLNRQNNRLNIR